MRGRNCGKTLLSQGTSPKDRPRFLRQGMRDGPGTRTFLRTGENEPYFGRAPAGQSRRARGRWPVELRPLRLSELERHLVIAGFVVALELPKLLVGRPVDLEG